MRVMAIDYGDRRTGFAFSDLTNTLVGDAFTVEEYDPQRLAERIAGECEKREVGTVVLGLPKNMDGTEGFRAERTRRFASLVAEKTGVKVMFTDERLSTVEAYTYMNITGVPGSKRKGKIDALSAQIILQSFLDSQKNR